MFDFVIRMVRSRIIDLTGKKVDVVLASNIFEHVLAIKMANRPTSVGILANQMRDFDSVREFFTSGTVVAATDLVTVKGDDNAGVTVNFALETNNSGASLSRTSSVTDGSGKAVVN